MVYIIIYSYFENDDINDCFVDSHVVFTNFQLLEKFLERLLFNHPSANVQVFKCNEMELSYFYES